MKLACVFLGSRVGIIPAGPGVCLLRRYTVAVPTCLWPCGATFCWVWICGMCFFFFLLCVSDCDALNLCCVKSLASDLFLYQSMKIAFT